MDGTAIRNFWVEGQDDYVRAWQKVSLIRDQKIDYPRPAQYAKNPDAFWDEVKRLDDERERTLYEATRELSTIRKKLEGEFEQKCRARLDEEKAGEGPPSSGFDYGDP